MKVSVSNKLQESYDKTYSPDTALWMELGAKGKYENIEAVTKGKTFGKVLEWGSGDGSLLKFLDASPKMGDLYGLEISESGIREIEARGLKSLKEIRSFDGYTTPYEDNTFDLAVLSHVLEHVEHPRSLLRELKRISRRQVVEIPLDYRVRVDEESELLLSYGHIDIYTPTTLRFLLKSEGLKILGDHYSRYSTELMRHSWYKMREGKKKNLLNDARLALYRITPVIRRLLVGKKRYEEFYNNAYTVYTESLD